MNNAEQETVSLFEAARSGRFGTIELGTSRDEIESRLGPPDAWSPPKDPASEAAIWKYGELEFHIAGETVWLIHMDKFQVPRGSRRLKIDPWVVRRGLPLADFEAALKSEQIDYQVETPSASKRQVVVLTAGGVRFRFQVEPEEEQPELGLLGMSFLDA